MRPWFSSKWMKWWRSVEKERPAHDPEHTSWSVEVVSWLGLILPLIVVDNVDKLMMGASLFQARNMHHCLSVIYFNLFLYVCSPCLKLINTSSCKYQEIKVTVLIYSLILIYWSQTQISLQWIAKSNRLFNKCNILVGLLVRWVMPWWLINERSWTEPRCSD